MNRFLWIRSPFLVFIWTLSGCLANPAQHYVGIPPIIDAADVEQSSSRINRVMTALARDTGGGTYYDLTEAGFNYIDDRCTEYFSELFYLNRRREAAKAGLSAFSQTTNAILAASGASTLSMAAVTQAFGLASNLTDIAAGTYLYQLPPATTLTFVRKLQGAYRDAVAAKASQINSPTTSYHLIQDYLSLCLPPVIEAKLVEHVSDAAATPVRGGSVSNIEIDVRTNSALPRKPEIIPDVRQQAKAVVQPEKVQPYAFGYYESRLSRERVARIQRSLCVSPVDGVISGGTRAAIDDFFRGVQEGAGKRKYPSVSVGGLQSVHENKLLQAEKVVGGTCVPSRDKSAFEIGRLVD
ncbi:exported hypothetical protein [Mesorhizobium sp. ORS 3324]|nr:exported hypothetical protein [Mesorhizobium sp. ORS 3324]